MCEGGESAGGVSEGSESGKGLSDGGESAGGVSDNAGASAGVSANDGAAGADEGCAGVDKVCASEDFFFLRCRLGTNICVLLLLFLYLASSCLFLLFPIFYEFTITVSVQI